MNQPTRPIIVFTAAVMDLLHEGHVNLLKQMRSKGDLVLVVLHDEKSTFLNKGKTPVESLEKRTMNLIHTGLVDIVMHTYSQDPCEEFRRICGKFCRKFDLLFMRGNDWPDFPGHHVVRDLGIPIELVPYTEEVSSTKIKENLR